MVTKRQNPLVTSLHGRVADLERQVEWLMQVIKENGIEPKCHGYGTPHGPGENPAFCSTCQGDR